MRYEYDEIMEKIVTEVAFAVGKEAEGHLNILRRESFLPCSKSIIIGAFLYCMEKEASFIIKEDKKYGKIINLNKNDYHSKRFTNLYFTFIETLPEFQEDALADYIYQIFNNKNRTDQEFKFMSYIDLTQKNVFQKKYEDFLQFYLKNLTGATIVVSNDS